MNWQFIVVDGRKKTLFTSDPINPNGWKAKKDAVSNANSEMRMKSKWGKVMLKKVKPKNNLEVSV